MKVAIAYGPWSLTFRGSLDLGPELWDDPRGLSGSELAVVRLAEELGADVFAPGKGCRPIESLKSEARNYDIVVAINEPELLRGIEGPKRVCYQLINSFEYCKVGFEQHIDTWLSPSDPHRQMILGMEHEVAAGTGAPKYKADPETWKVVPLGCDPHRYDGHKGKIPGRVVYCSSPDRGLHWLLQEWPAIKRAVPHATLHIFYRLRAWIDGFANTAYFPPIENLRDRALYVDECLRRMSGPEWGITVRDSVSRATIEREMALAEVLAYPCDTVRWSEGFSCTILEACAARACPVITDCDALGEIYKDAVAYEVEGLRRDITMWREMVQLCLTNDQYRGHSNRRGREFAERHTWKHTAQKLLEAVA